MNEQTFDKRLKQLVTLLHIHPYRDELIQLMADQVADDTETLT